MKKILILNYEYPPLWWGAWFVSQKYADWLEKLWNKVTVITTWFEWEKEYEEKWNLEIYKLKSKRKKEFQSNPIEMLSWVYKSIKFLDNFLKNNSFDICISFFSIPGWIVARHIYKKFKIPYIISTHWADIPWFYPEKMKKFHILTNWYAKKIWEDAENILVLTTEMKKLADKFWKPNKNIILPNGVDIDLFVPSQFKNTNKFTILFVWRLSQEKDTFTMLESIKKLSQTNKNFILHIVWDWPLRLKMENFVKNNDLWNNINFTWWLSKEQLRDYYQSSHIQICSSRVEAMSIAILESLFSGLYILSTPVSWNTDMIEEWINWEFFNIWDYNKLWEKLVYWSKNYKNLEFDYTKDKFLREKYSWDKIINDLNNIIVKNA